jgi:hypothetical protein
MFSIGRIFVLRNILPKNVFQLQHFLKICLKQILQEAIGLSGGNCPVKLELSCFMNQFFKQEDRATFQTGGFAAPGTPNSVFFQRRNQFPDILR